MSAHAPDEPPPDPYFAHLATEKRNDASRGLDRMEPEELVELMCREDEGVVAAVRAEAPRIARAVETIAERMARGGRLVYCGAGTSGRLGVLDAAECPPTFNTDPARVVGLIAGGPPAFLKAVEGAEDSPELGAGDVDGLGVGPDDVVVGIAASGRTPYVLGALRRARELGAATVGLSCSPGSEVAAAAETAITPVVGAEILSGSTRLKAGTATKMVLNALSTGAMVRLGKCYDNLMVDVVASNEKLRRRSVRIVAQGLEVAAAAAGEGGGGAAGPVPDYARAEELLTACGGEVKTAIVAGAAAVAPDRARAALEAAGGFVRRALAALADGPGGPR